MTAVYKSVTEMIGHTPLLETAGIEKEMFGRYIRPVDFAAETAGKLEAYYNLEHERWMTYIRTEGWRLATKGGDSLEDIRKCYEEYCAEFKNQNYMMKLHPALVPIEKTKPEIAVLREVEDMMADVTRRKGFGEWTPDYVQSDAEVVNHIGDIVGGAWCGAGGISIHGIPAKEGECVICRLSDMMEYYGRMYRERKKEGSPEEIIKKYGADTARIFILFAAPPERDLEWSDQGVEGAWRFLQRVWRIVLSYAEKVKENQPLDTNALTKDEKELFRILNVTIQKVTEDVGVRGTFNTAISSVMELVNAFYAFKDGSLNAGLAREVVINLIKLLAPFAPHITEKSVKAAVFIIRRGRLSTRKPPLPTKLK